MESSSNHESDIAIIGMSCRFPGASNIKAFWENLSGGVESVSFFSDQELLAAGVDPELLAAPNYVKASPTPFDVDMFDANFFSFAPKEAQIMDPQQRIFLECAWEALEDAGCIPEVTKEVVGVYAGAALNSYFFYHLDPEEVGLAGLAGNEKDYLSTRVAYKLDLRGPAVTIQSACSSALVAIHMACQNLLNGECDVAIAGGVAIRNFYKSGYLYQEDMIFSPDGHCRSFDADSKGTLFGNGAGVVVLKPLTDALADGDNIYAVIKGSAINNDGAQKVGYTAPSAEGQAAVIKEAQAIANVVPQSISYIEAHGTATAFGDPIEIAALTRVFRESTDKKGFCPIGTVKSNFGHLDAAAGVAGLIKTILALKNRQIPPSLHYKKANSNIDFDNSPFYVNTELSDWQSNEQPRRAGVSSFGIGGTNAHIILEEAPDILRKTLGPNEQRPQQLLTLSAKTKPALADLIGIYDKLFLENPHGDLADVCCTAAQGRCHFEHRLTLVADSIEEAHVRLQNKNYRVDKAAVAAPKTAFLFTGQGAQYIGMGRQLFETQPLFREILVQCDAILRPLNVPLLELLYGDNADSDMLNQTVYTQPALFSIEYALAKLWQSWGVFPDAVMGHSVGEYVAACIADVFCLEDGLKLIAARARLMQTLCKTGEMLALPLDEAKVQTLIAPYSDRISIAAINGPQSVVISGEADAIKLLSDKLKEQHIEAKSLAVSHAFHSVMMEPMLADFEKIAANVNYRMPSLPVCSNVTGQLINDELTKPTYWVQQVRQPVRFAAGVVTLQQQAIEIFLEIGPKPILLSLAGQSISNEMILPLPSLRDRGQDWQQLLDSLGQWHLRGGVVDWQTFYADYKHNKVSLPSYPFQRERYWVDKRSVKKRARRDPTLHPLLGKRLRLADAEKIYFESEVDLSSSAWLTEHSFFDMNIFPASGYLEMALAAAKSLTSEAKGKILAQLQDVRFEQTLILELAAPQTMQVVLSADDQGYEFKILSQKGEASWTPHVSGRLVAVPSELPSTVNILAEVQSQCPIEMSVDEHYAMAEERGVSYGPRFRGIQRLYKGHKMALAHIQLPEPTATDVNEVSKYYLHPALFDACLQILGTAIPVTSAGTFMPVGVQDFRVYQSSIRTLWSFVQLVELSDDKVVTDISLFDLKGETVAELKGFEIGRIAEDTLVRQFRKHADDFYEIEWQKLQLDKTITTDDLTDGQWLILADRQGIGQALAAKFERQGKRCVLVYAGSDIEQDGKLYLDPSRPNEVKSYLNSAFAASGASLDGIVSLWSLDASSADELCQGSLAEAQTLVCGSTLQLVKAITELGLITKLCLVTQSAVKTACNLETMAIAQAPLWGLGKVIAMEYPELGCKCIDLDQNGCINMLFDELIMGDSEAQIALHSNKRFVARLVSHGLGANLDALDIPLEPYQMSISRRGSLDSLKLTKTPRLMPKSGQVEIKVSAAGLNFRDVLNALDMYPGNPPFGGECSGIIIGIGDDVEGLSVGDAVIAAAPNSFSQSVVVNASEVVIKPERLSFEEAATIPVVFLTAWYALRELAYLSAGERVLIHAGAGGVGMAAIQIARLVGAEVFVTASPAKWRQLESLGVKNIMNSRTTEFADQIMELTCGEGIDVVLNSLTSDDFIPKSLSVLRSGGRFLEISVVNTWRPEQVKAFNPELSYFLINLAQLGEEQPVLVQEMMKKLMGLFELGELKPIPYKSFPISESISAFRYMQQGRHSGKIILTMPNLAETQALVRDGVSYLITGGLGDLGLEVAQWLVNNGARHIVLSSRSQPTNKATEIILQLQSAGAQVRVINADLACETQVAQLFAEIDSNMPTLKGVIHAAGLLDDGVIAQQDMERFERVMAPKVTGSWHLHTLTKNKALDFFVCFSSTVSLLGSAGQANYASANAFMDCLVHYRRQMGLPALSINWGPWASIGMAARMYGHERELGRLHATGITAIKPNQGMLYLEQLLLQTASAQVGVIPVNWSKFFEQLPKVPIFLSEVVKSTSSVVDPISIKQQLKQARKEEYPNVLADFIRNKLSAVLGISRDQIDVKQPLTSMALDSLMTIELRNRIRLELGIDIPMSKFMNAQTTILDLVLEIDPWRVLNIKPTETLKEGEEEFEL